MGKSTACGLRGEGGAGEREVAVAQMGTAPLCSRQRPQATGGKTVGRYMTLRCVRACRWVVSGVCGWGSDWQCYVSLRLPGSRWGWEQYFPNNNISPLT